MQQLMFSNTILSRYTWIPIANRVIYQEQGGPYTTYVPAFPTGKQVIDEYNNKYGLVSFGAHGGDCNIAVATKGDNGGVDQGPVKYKVTSFDNGSPGCCAIDETGNSFENMTNINHPNIMYSYSCETMPFDPFHTPTGDRNMGETFTCAINAGGPAYLGNTRYGVASKALTLTSSFGKIIM